MGLNSFKELYEQYPDYLRPVEKRHLANIGKFILREEDSLGHDTEQTENVIDDDIFDDEKMTATEKFLETTLEKLGIFGYVYEDVNLLVKYTGKIVIGNSFIDEYYKHMGLQRAWAYKKVLELIFEKGRLVEVIDHSETVQKIREEMESEKNPYEYFEHWWI